MAENPAHWSPCVKLIDKALHDWELMLETGDAWISQAQYLHDKLEKAGFLVRPINVECSHGKKD